MGLKGSLHKNSGSTYQEDIAIVNVYVPSNRARTWDTKAGQGPSSGGGNRPDLRSPEQTRNDQVKVVLRAMKAWKMK